MKSAREVAEEMVREPYGDAGEWRSHICDDVDYVPLEVKSSLDFADDIVADACALIERLVTRERAAAREPLVQLLQKVRAHLEEDFGHSDTGSSWRQSIESLLEEITSAEASNG